MTKNGYSPSQQAMIDIFSDGEPHGKTELLEALAGYVSSPGALRKALCMLRKRLPKDQTILCLLRNRRIFYQHVRLLSPPPDEETSVAPSDTERR